MRKAIVTLILGGAIVFGASACTPVLTNGIEGTDDAMTCTIDGMRFETSVYQARLFAINNPTASCVKVG